MKYEYLTIDLEARTDPEDVLSENGVYGWELVAVIVLSHTVRHYLKRSKASDNED